jgi:hypothetical protein
MIVTSAEAPPVFFTVMDHVESATALPVPIAVATARAAANDAAAMGRRFRYRLNIVCSFTEGVSARLFVA